MRELLDYLLGFFTGAYVMLYIGELLLWREVKKEDKANKPHD